MLGISALAPEDPARTAALIACVCLADSSACARVDHAVDMLRIGSAVAARRKSHSPVGYLAQAGTELAVAGVLADPQSFVAQIRARVNQGPAQAPPGTHA